MTDPWAGQFDRSTSEIWLVTNLQDGVVKSVHFLGDFPDVVTFAAGEIFMLKCLRVLVIAASFALNVVFEIQRRHGPGVPVLRIKKTDLNDDAAFRRLGYEVFKPPEKCRVPLV